MVALRYCSLELGLSPRPPYGSSISWWSDPPPVSDPRSMDQGCRPNFSNFWWAKTHSTKLTRESASGLPWKTFEKISYNPLLSHSNLSQWEKALSVTTPGRLRLWNRSKTAAYTHSHLRPIHSPQIIFRSSWIKSTLDEGQMGVPSNHGERTGHSAPSSDHRHRQLAKGF